MLRKSCKQNFNICLKNVPLICVVAHFVAHKNHKLFLQAIHKLIYEKNIPVEVVLVGEGLLRNDLEELSKKLSLQKDVHFLGFSFKIPEILYYSDIKVLPSLDEAFGVVILEAALMKKPIILSQGVSLANVLIKHEQTGLLFDPMNANELVDQIMRLINNNDFAKQLGENSYNYVRKYFSAEASIEQHKSIYMTLYQEKIFN